MQSELKRLQLETGITFVFVTHDQEEALTMSDRIAVMNPGRILQLGTPHQIYHAPAERFVADFIGDTNFLDLTVASPRGDEAGARPARRRSARAPSARRTAAREGRHRDGGDSARTGAADRCGHGRPAGRGHWTTVFFGTDTHLHLRLSDGQGFILRRQNNARTAEPVRGTRLGLRLTPGALRVLRG